MNLLKTSSPETKEAERILQKLVSKKGVGEITPKEAQIILEENAFDNKRANQLKVSH